MAELAVCPKAYNIYYLTLWRISWLTAALRAPNERPLTGLKNPPHSPLTGTTVPLSKQTVLLKSTSCLQMPVGGPPVRKSGLIL